MTEINQSRELLSNALRQYSEADSEAKIELAVLALHKGLEKAMRTYLESQGFGNADHRQINFPDLVDLIRDYTDLFEGDPNLPSLLVSLNTTRAKIAHPGKDKPTPTQISRDAKRFSELVRRFWPKLFGEAFPVSLITPLSRPRGEKPIISEPLSKPRPIEPQAQSSSKLHQFLRHLWRDESEPHFQKKLFFKRVIGIAILFVFSKWCNTGAIYTVRWPVPIKYVGVALFLLAVGMFLWGILIIWKVLRQLRLKGLLTVLGVGYVLLISVSVLTSGGFLPFHQEVWMTTQRLIVSVNRNVRDVGRALVSAPEEFRFAYTGRRRPILLPGMDPSYLTPIPANHLAQVSLTLSPVPTMYETRVASSPSSTDTPSASPQAQEQPTVVPLYPPGCPDSQARMTVPLMNQVIKDTIQVEGTASIENFDYYKFECRREDGEVEDEWHWLASFDTPIEEGALGALDVSPLPAGIYTLRLTVVDREGNNPFLPCDVQVRIARP